MAHLPIWYLGSVPPAVCDAALADLKTIEPRDAAMGMHGDSHNHQQRNTTIRFANEDHWFGQILFGHGVVANRVCNWDFEITHHESVQLAEYAPGQHYDWHVDTFFLSGAPTDRKVTVVCLLSDPAEYEGGDLELRFYAEYPAPLQKGSMIAFPSLLEHRVRPVVSGQRYSATMWLQGSRFK